MSNEINLRTANAIFQADGKPDVNVSVFIGGTGPIAMRADMGGEQLLAVTFPVQGSELQVAEVLQFTADTISAEVPGRLSAFERGFVSTASDIREAYGDVPDEEMRGIMGAFSEAMRLEDEEAQREFATGIVSMLMAKSIEKGWNLQGAILDKLNEVQNGL